MFGVGTKTITYHIPIQLIMISFYTYTLQYIIQYKCTLPTTYNNTQQSNHVVNRGNMQILAYHIQVQIDNAHKQQLCLTITVSALICNLKFHRSPKFIGGMIKEFL